MLCSFVTKRRTSSRLLAWSFKQSRIFDAPSVFDAVNESVTADMPRHVRLRRHCETIDFGGVISNISPGGRPLSNPSGTGLSHWGLSCSSENVACGDPLGFSKRRAQGGRRWRRLDAVPPTPSEIALLAQGSHGQFYWGLLSGRPPGATPQNDLF